MRPANVLVEPARRLGPNVIRTPVLGTTGEPGRKTTTLRRARVASGAEMQDRGAPFTEDKDG